MTIEIRSEHARFGGRQGFYSHLSSETGTKMARNLTDVEELFLRHRRFLITDRDAKYPQAFRAVLAWRTTIRSATIRGWKTDWYDVELKASVGTTVKSSATSGSADA